MSCLWLSFPILHKVISGGGWTQTQNLPIPQGKFSNNSNKEAYGEECLLMIQVKFCGITETGELIYRWKKLRKD